MIVLRPVFRYFLRLESLHLGREGVRVLCTLNCGRSMPSLVPAMAVFGCSGFHHLVRHLGAVVGIPDRGMRPRPLHKPMLSGSGLEFPCHSYFSALTQVQRVCHRDMQGRRPKVRRRNESNVLCSTRIQKRSSGAAGSHKPGWAPQSPKHATLKKKPCDPCRFHVQYQTSVGLVPGS